MKHHLLTLATLATLASLAAAYPAFAAPANWIAVWASPPTPAGPMTKSFENQTIRQVMRVTAGGKRVRIRISNEYGSKPLVIGAASIARATGDGASVSATAPLTFNGKTTVTIPPNAPIYSDPVDLVVKPLEFVSVSVFYPQKTGPCSCHVSGLQTAYISGPGDFTKADFAPASTLSNRLFVSEIQIEPTAPTPVVITFGDSITDGAGSTVNSMHRWPDILANRLGGKIAVASEGLSGNRVLNFENPIFGESALSRLDRDLMSVQGVKWVILLEGINDLGLTTQPRPTKDDLIMGYRQIVDRAHQRGIKVYGATILPYEGAFYYSTEGENSRQEINAWMRSKDTAFDGLVDFDKAMRDPAHPTRIRADKQSGDWLHPNDAGYQVMGDAIDLKLLR